MTGTIVQSYSTLLGSATVQYSTDALLARRQHPAHTAYRIRYTSPRMRMKVLYGEDAGPSDEELEARAMRRGAARRGRRSGSRFGLVGATEGTSERSGMRDRTACRRRRTNPSRTLPGGRRKGGHLYWGGRGRAGDVHGAARRAILHTGATCYDYVSVG